MDKTPADDASRVEYGHLDSAVGRSLLLGLSLTVAVMVVGLILTISAGQSARHVVSLHQLPRDLEGGHWPALLNLGILLLFATPVLGVVVSLAGFARDGDRAFLVVDLLLLLALGAGFAVALR